MPACQLGQSPEAVARVVEFARQRHLQVQWLVVPQRPGESELIAALQDSGFDLAEDLLLMAVPLEEERRARGRRRALRPTGGSTRYLPGHDPAIAHRTRCSPTSTAVDCASTAKVTRGDHGKPARHGALAGAAGGLVSLLRRCVGRRLVGGCYASLFEDIPTVMGVYTMPDVRHQGVARAARHSCGL